MSTFREACPTRCGNDVRVPGGDREPHIVVLADRGVPHVTGAALARFSRIIDHPVKAPRTVTRSADEPMVPKSRPPFAFVIVGSLLWMSLFASGSSARLSDATRFRRQELRADGRRAPCKPSSLATMPLYTNLDGATADKGPLDILKWQWERLRTGAHRDDGASTPRVDNDGRSVAEPGSHLTWIGHATFALRLGGKLVVTDPIWSTHIQGAIKRRVAPGVRLEDMPPIDIVTISHSHFDHLDLPSLRRIGRNATYVVPRDVGKLLLEAGLPHVVELGWWERFTAGNLTVTLVPAQHWSMRVPWDRNRRLWGGFVYEAPEGVAYHAGDTAYSARVFREIGARFPALDWAMLPIGAYEPAWFMKSQHMGPEEAAQAFDDLGAKNLVAMHWGTFKLTDEPTHEPPTLLRASLKARGTLDDRIWIPAIGETRTLR